MKRLYGLLFVLMACFGAHPGSCFGQTQCPWMNAATAGGFLGGDAQLAVTGITVDGDATCEFTRKGSMLRIAVHTMPHLSKDYPGYLTQCGSAFVSLRGIGNEAIRCIQNSGAAKGEELIIGRVRDRAFFITIKADWITSPPSSPTKTRNPISDDSENVAEQVAGSMF